MFVGLNQHCKYIKLKDIHKKDHINTKANMGWYTNYEVEFDDFIDWDDNDVKRCLKPFNVDYLYLRDMDKPRVMVCVYSQNSVIKILIALKSLYSTSMRFRMYNSEEEWIAFT